MCKERSVSYLNELGYTVVRLPSEDIRPLQVFYKPNGGLKRLGPISDFVVEQNGVPEISRDNTVSDVAGLRTDNFELGTGLKFLEKFLSLIGASGVGLEASFKNAGFLQFIYKNVMKDYVVPTEIGEYLGRVTPNVNSPFMDCINEDGEAYIITEILKSNAFGVIAYDKNGVELSLDISTLKQLLSVAPKIKVSKEGENVISFKGDKFLCFAFKAIVLWINIENGKAKFRLRVPSGPVPPIKALATTFIETNEPTYVVFPNTLVRLK